MWIDANSPLDVDIDFGEDLPAIMDSWPQDGNELTIRLAGWWDMNTWLLVGEQRVPMKDRES